VIPWHANLSFGHVHEITKSTLAPCYHERMAHRYQEPDGSPSGCLNGSLESVCMGGSWVYKDAPAHLGSRGLIPSIAAYCIDCLVL
jgi:hypothetical protein